MHGVVIIARVLHIVTGVYWVGAVLFLGIFVGPTVFATGPSGAIVMRELVRRRHFEFTVAMATITILSGLCLVWIDSAHFDPAWFRTSFGQGISTGMVAAIVAYLVAIFGIRPQLRRLGALEAQLASAGAAPHVGVQLGAARRRMVQLSGISLVLLLVAVTAMSVARYI